MLNAPLPSLRNQAWISAGVFLAAIWLAWKVGNIIAIGDMHDLALLVFALAGCAVAVMILRSWRSGFYLFLVWLMFEDLARKYLGNGTALFFGKDILVGLIYLSLFIAIRRGREKTFRPAFLLPLLLFLWLGVIQIFNPNSPSVLYGLLGFKLDFYYIPLLFVGYALIRSDEDLKKFLLANVVLASVISALGIAQAILGNSFLNPAHLAPELQELGNLDKVTPITGQVLSLPTSVFVSSGRFGFYLMLAAILVVGTVGYLLLYTNRNRKIAFAAIALVGAAAFFSGSRGTLIVSAVSILVLAAGFLWGAPWRRGQAHRIVKAIRRSLVVAALGLTAVLLIFPQKSSSRISFYNETLNPESPAYALHNRAWTYPMQNLADAFIGQHWIVGTGLGTASLGTQYVSKLLGEKPPGVWVEEGYGVLIVEMGILAPFLWILWSASMLYYSWRVVRQLRQTRLFPIAFAIFWYAFVLLYPMTFGGLSIYQNYINNAFLWLLIGILFRLPSILEAQRAPEIASAPAPTPLHARCLRLRRT